MNSGLKPKVICKNLEDIIKESMFSTKRSSIGDSSKRQNSQRGLKSQPRHRKSNERCNTSINCGNRLCESNKKLNMSLSKHSLESKEKINFFDVSAKTSTHDGSFTKNNESNKKVKNTVFSSSAVEFYPSGNKKSRKETLSFGEIPAVHTKSLYFNQIDAIFTDLEDFLRQTREKICLQIDFLNEQNTANLLANQLTELSNLFKQEIFGILQKKQNKGNQIEILRPKNKISQTPHRQQPSKPKSLKQQTSATKSFSNDAVFSQSELIKIEEFMQRQNTINSTINSQAHDDIYLPTETDAELLSMLVYKNKLNSTKRKIQNTYNHDQEILGPWVKSGRSVKNPNEEEYSFRKSNSKDKGKITNFNNGMVGQVSLTFKKNKKNPLNCNQKTINKENREKSIYEIVLQENRRAKGNWLK